MSLTTMRIGALLSCSALLVAITPVPATFTAVVNRSPVAASGIGNPHVNFLNGNFLPTSPVGDPHLIAALESGAATPSSMALADLDEDGVDDLVTGYTLGNSGFIGLRRGNIDARHPNGPYARERKQQGVFFEEPFALEERLLPVPIKPSFVAAAEISGDGHGDILVASDADSVIVWLPGHGDMAFAAGRRMRTPGPVSLLETADVNRPDGRADVVAGVGGANAALLVFEGPEGSIHAEAEAFPLTSPPTASIVDRLDREAGLDIAVAAGRELVIISGRDRKISLDGERRRAVPPARIRTDRLAAPIRSLTVGGFLDIRQRDLAVALEDGTIGVRESSTGDFMTLPYQFQETIAMSPGKVAAKENQELVVLARDALHILHSDHFASISPTGVEGSPPIVPAPAPISFELGFEAADMFVRRLNWDAPDDIAVVGQGADGAALAIVNSAPMKTFVVDDSGDDGDRFFNDGECLTEAGVCTFRAATEEANRTEGPHAIQFEVGTVTAATQGFGVNQLTTVDGESFGSRIAFQGNALITVNASGSLIKGISAASIVGGDQFTAVNVYASVAPDGITAMNGSGLVAGGHLSILGGTNEAERNVTAAMALNGGSNTVIGNYVGLRADGSGALENAQIRQYGFRIQSDANIIGGLATGAANYIAGFPGSGLGSSAVYLSGGSNRFQGNHIGTDVDGTIAVPNGGQGLSVHMGNPEPAFRGPTSVLDNVVAASGQEGILAGANDGLLVQGNFIGTDRTSVAVIGNALAGIWISADSAVTVGGVAAPTRNVIVNNGTDGIQTRFSLAGGRHLIQGNSIGVTRFGTPMPNMGQGILLRNSGGSLIGGTDQNAANEIAHNGQHGIRFNTTAEGHEILGNSIHSNGMLGISFGRRGDLPELNDAGDTDEGPNGEQNYPVLTHTGNGNVEVNLNSLPNADYVVEYFGNPECDPSGHGEGQYYLGVDVLTTDESGDASLTRNLSAFEGRNFVSATATDAEGNTSEFSVCVEIDPTEAILVRVMQTPLVENPGPIANTEFEVGKLNLGNPQDPFDRFDDLVSDGDGILVLDPGFFAVGDPFYVRTKVAEKKALTVAHDPLDGLTYELFVDNMVVNDEGHFEAYHIEPGITDTYLSHASIAYNLVASIEWPATAAYVSSLQDFFRSASNLLFDATDGQAYFDKVAIYDDRKNFHLADLRLYTNNQQWPMARPGGIGFVDNPMRFPPQHFALTPAANADLGFTEFPVDLDAYDGYAPFVHEFGHYAFGFFDEYLTGVGGGRVRSLNSPINYGLMADPLLVNDSDGDKARRSTELSAWVLDGYEETLHFQLRAKPTFETFRDLFSGVYGGIPVEIRTPMRRGMSTGAVVTGPNDDLDSPDLDVGSWMSFSLDVTQTAPPTVEYLALGSDGEALPGVFVEIVRDNGPNLLQGRAVVGDVPGTDEFVGMIRIRGAMDGDRLLFSHPTMRNGLPVPGEWDFLETPVSVSGKTSLVTVQLNRVGGNFDLLSRIAFDGSGNASYSVETSTAFEGAPEVEFINNEGDSQVLPLTVDDAVYSAGIPALTELSSIRFRGEDSQGMPFFFTQALYLQELSDGEESLLQGPAVEVQLGATQGVELIALLESEFPAPTTGLPDSSLRVSPVYSLSTFPINADYSGQLTLYYNGESKLAADTSAVDIYRWTGGSWQAMTTGVSKQFGVQLASTQVREDGYYAAYLDLTKSTGVANEPVDELPAVPGLDYVVNYPNPFRDGTTILLELDSPAAVNLEVFNLLGQVVARKELGRLPGGTQEVRFEADHMPSGTYPYVVQIGDKTVRGWMTIAR